MIGSSHLVQVIQGFHPTCTLPGLSLIRIPSKRWLFLGEQLAELDLWLLFDQSQQTLPSSLQIAPLTSSLQSLTSGNHFNQNKDNGEFAQQLAERPYRRR